MEINIQVKRRTETTPIPQYNTDMAAGVDLHADIPAPVFLQPGEQSVLIPTGIAAYIGSRNFMAAIFPRSGLGHKKGLVLGNGTGVIDPDYQGEIFVSMCVRPGHEPVTINPGDRIAQLVFIPVARANFTVVEEFNANTTRGAGGFGSTGT